MTQLQRLTLLAALTLLSACGPDQIINETQEIPDGDWAFSDVHRFSVNVEDTLTPFNFLINVRHGGTYAYRNLIVIVKTYFPNNSFKVDTIDCPLADPSGRWYGNGLGDLLDNRIMFKRNIQLPMGGSYNFELQHAMRPDTVHEIYDIGIGIESAVD